MAAGPDNPHRADVRRNRGGQRRARRRRLRRRPENGSGALFSGRGVMEQNIAYPSYALRYEHARGHLEELAQPAGVNLQQSYASLVSRLAL
jgi:hypothetical protein